MKQPQWVLREVVFAAHDQSLAQFGGAAGLRDDAMLDSALGKPLNLFAYGKPSVFDLAASHASEVDVALRTLAMAAGEVSEAAYSEWLKVNSNPTLR